jgi:hypothetical protein
MRAPVFALLLVACSAAKAAPPNPSAQPGKPVSSMPPGMDVTFARLFAKDGLSKLSAYPVEIHCFDPLRPEDTKGMVDGQEHSPEMSLTRDPSEKGFDAFSAWLGKIPRKPGTKVVYARAFDGAKHVGWAALCIEPPAALAASDFSSENVPDKTVRLTPAALEKLKKLPPDVNVAFMLEETTLLTTAPVTSLLQAGDPTITFKQPGT